MLAAASCLRRAQIELCHDLVLSDVIFVHLLVLVRVMALLLLDFPAKLGNSLVSWNFETSRKAASIFVEELWGSRLRGVLNLILHVRADSRHFTFGVNRTNSQA